MNLVRSSFRLAAFIPTAWLSLLAPSQSLAGAKVPFEFLEGDRVVLLGDTLIEREQEYAYFEQRLTVEFPNRHVIFRNLGWSADTPAGDSRAAFDFDKPGKGFDKLKQHLATVQPTVVVLGYGMANSLERSLAPIPREQLLPITDPILEQFKTNMTRLMDSIIAVCTGQPPAFIVLSPVTHEDLGPSLPNPKVHNQLLKSYSEALREIAFERSCRFVSLYDLLGDGTKSDPPRPLTENGIHLSAFGYWRAAQALEQELEWKPGGWQVSIGAAGRQSRSQGALISDVERRGDHVRFALLPNRLIDPRQPGKMAPASPACSVQILGLKAGLYQLLIDGGVVATATDKQWRAGIATSTGPEFEQAEALRQAILKKNELYFDRWRPQNETYLFGFRKYEQGQNAKEIPMFDPLIEQQEQIISNLSKSRNHIFELVPTTGSPWPVKNGVMANSTIQQSNNPTIQFSATASLQHSNAPPLVSESFEIAPGFEVNLFAESPLLAKPIQMNFDPQGRLWVASSEVYPQIQPGQPANDKILVLEDRDGDGFAEKSTVFADGLLIPTGVAPGDGGAYVGQSTELLFLKDTDGDGKADQKRIILSGFGTEDTHHIVHTLRWGMDGQLYFNQSIYIHSHIETPNGVQRLNSGGIWHLRPPTLELGVFLRGFCNPWGHAFDDFGQSFVTDGAGFQGVSFGLPGATYFTYADMRRELKSISAGNYPKFAGLELIRSSQFPPQWQGNAVTCDFRAHRIVRFDIQEQGSAYMAKELDDLLRTTNVTFRPIDVKLGPDGALYIADWSNPIIQHGEVDFRDPRRDHEHGRIWRVKASSRPLVERPNLVKASTENLLAQLLSPNAFNQQQARRVLIERGSTIRRELDEWTRWQTNDQGRLEALWMYQAIDIVEPALLENLLKANDGRVRAGATRVVGYWHPRLKRPLDLLTRAVSDDHPRVRLEAMRALAEIPSERSAELVLSALEKPMDEFLDYGAWLSINDLAEQWIASLSSGHWKIDGREKQFEFGVKAIKPKMATIALRHGLELRDPPPDGSGPWIELIGTAGDEVLLRRLFEQVLRGGLDAPATERALQALNDAASKREARPGGSLKALERLLSSKDEKIRVQAFRLAGNWKVPEYIPELLATASAPSSSPNLRDTAFKALRNLGGEKVVTGLLAMATNSAVTNGSGLATNSVTNAQLRPPLSRDIRQQAVLTLAALDFEQASQPAVDLLLEPAEETQVADLWRGLLAIKETGPKLARVLPKTGLPPVMARSGLRVVREAGRNEPDLVWALTRGGDLESDTASLSAADLQQMATRAATEGDPSRGEKVFRRRDLACVTCHSIGGVGGKVGPDLTSIGASSPVDYLVESLLYPNRKIKEGYHSVIIETKEGSEFSGVLVSENSEQLVLRDATDKERTILKSNVQNRSLGNSLMPSGLLEPLTPGERLDLIRFLSELGKPGAYDASKGNVARSWKLLAQTHELAQFGDEKALQIKPADQQWKTARSLVDGRLVKQDLEATLDGLERRQPRAIFAAAQFQVTKAGSLSLDFIGADGAPAWLDGNAAGTCGNLKPQLEAGVHTIIVKLDTKNIPEAIRLQSDDATFVSW